MNNDDNIPFTDAEIANCPIEGQEPASAQSSERSEKTVADANEGVKPSITTPDNTILLNHGIDSLYLSFAGDLSGQTKEKLQSMKIAASDSRTESTAQIFITTNSSIEVFKVHAQGRHMFKYVISNGKYEIQLSERNESSKLPFALVKIISQTLSETPADLVVNHLHEIIEKLGDINGDSKVSRLDLFCDVVTDFDLSKLTEEDFSCRASSYKRYVENGRFTGLTFGMGGDIAFRLYDKTFESKKRNNPYIHDIWKEAGWTGDKKVWRFEFQVDRNVLKQFSIAQDNDGFSTISISSFNDIAVYQPHLWNYLTRDWLRLVVVNANDSHKYRWETHGLWQFIQGISNYYDYIPRIYAKPVPNRHKRRVILYRYYKICLTELMAWHNYDDVFLAQERGLVKARRFLNMHRKLVADITKGADKKRRNLGILLKSTTALTPVDTVVSQTEQIHEHYDF